MSKFTVQIEPTEKYKYTVNVHTDSVEELEKITSVLSNARKVEIDFKIGPVSERKIP